MKPYQKDRLKLVISLITPITILSIPLVEILHKLESLSDYLGVLVLLFLFYLPTICYWSYRWVKDNISFKE